MNTEWTAADEQALKFMQTHLDDPYPSEMDRLKLALACKTEANALLRADLEAAQKELAAYKHVRRDRQRLIITSIVLFCLLVWTGEKYLQCCRS